MASFLHWFATQFGETAPSLTGDTLAYWAQALGTVVAIFATIMLTFWQASREWTRENAYRKNLRQGVIDIGAGVVDIIDALLAKNLPLIHANKSLDLIREQTSALNEFHDALSSGGLGELAKAGITAPVIKLRKAISDVRHVLGTCDFSTALPSQTHVAILPQIRKSVADAVSDIPA